MNDNWFIKSLNMLYFEIMCFYSLNYKKISTYFVLGFDSFHVSTQIYLPVLLHIHLRLVLGIVLKSIESLLGLVETFHRFAVIQLLLGWMWRDSTENLILLDTVCLLFYRRKVLMVVTLIGHLFGFHL